MMQVLVLGIEHRSSATVRTVSLPEEVRRHSALPELALFSHQDVGDHGTQIIGPSHQCQLLPPCGSLDLNSDCQTLVGIFAL